MCVPCKLISMCTAHAVMALLLRQLPLVLMSESEPEAEPGEVDALSKSHAFFDVLLPYRFGMRCTGLLKYSSVGNIKSICSVVDGLALMLLAYRRLACSSSKSWSALGSVWGVRVEKAPALTALCNIAKMSSRMPCRTLLPCSPFSTPAKRLAVATGFGSKGPHKNLALPWKWDFA